MSDLWILDSECYRNYYFVGVRHVESGKAFGIYERWNDKIMANFPLPAGTFITFNGNNYDMPILGLAMAGATNATLKAASDDIILNGLKPWHLEDKYAFKRPLIDHIDLIEVAPGMASLKIYAGRLNSRRLQDLPIAPDAIIGFPERAGLTDYCLNSDCVATADLYAQLKPQIELREALGAKYGIDLRSKSDAQIAEAVIRKGVEAELGRRVYRPEIHPSYQFNYHPPKWVAFKTPGMRHVLDLVRRSLFGLGLSGDVQMPPSLDNLHVRINQMVYRMGIGGLHSTEGQTTHRGRIVDRDVASYYPSIILNEGYYPQHLDTAFLKVYRELVGARLAAKAAGDKVAADALKITINGSFGKLGSMWSVLYSPDLLIQVTITGQLALLMLIESLELAGVRVVSANTDGVMFIGDATSVIAEWERVTGFKTEETVYRSVHSKDVNNYVAIKEDGGVKTKGLYATAGISKNNTNSVCVEAVIAYLQSGTPIATTVGQCDDVRKFITVRKVEGGATWRGNYLGKAVRWYYSTDGDVILYSSNGNKVPKSEGARPMMNLTDNVPADINRQWYVDEAKSILHDLGAA